MMDKLKILEDISSVKVDSDLDDNDITEGIGRRGLLIFDSVGSDEERKVQGKYLGGHTNVSFILARS